MLVDIKNYIGDLLDNAPISQVARTRPTLYGLPTKKKLFIKCKFNNKRDWSYMRFLNKGPTYIKSLNERVQLRLCEIKARPTLQMMCAASVGSVGWVKFEGKEIKDNDKSTRCEHEFCCSWKALSSSDSDDLPPDPKVLSFDIEVYSHDDNKMQSPDDPRDEIFQISCVFSTSRTVLLTLGNANIEGVEVISYKSERQLIDGFSDLVNKENPNVIIGYNIFGFDIGYMLDRGGLGLTKMGFTKGLKGIEKEPTWSSSAFKNQSFRYVECDGRVIVDLLPLIRRDYKLPEYNLKTVSTHFLGETKDPLSAKDIFRCYREKTFDEVGKYCVQDSALVLRLFDHMSTWLGLAELAKVCCVDMLDLYTRGQQIRVYSQIYKHCTEKDIVVDELSGEGKTFDYVGAKVIDPIPGKYDCVLPFDFASLYPTIIIAYNLCYTTLVPNNVENVSDDDCHVISWDDHVGCQHDPKIIELTQLAKDIVVLESEITRLRKNKNMSKVSELSLQLKVARERRSGISKPTKNICGSRKFRFLKEPKGVLPSVIQNLLNLRAKTKQRMKNETDSGMKAVLNKRQLAQKISANSMYGGCGVDKGYIPCMPVAMCTTTMGRKSIRKVEEEIEKVYDGKVVYGDTDSTYVHFSFLDGKTPKDMFGFGFMVAEEISKLFPDPIRLEFENEVYSKLLMISKKRYTYKKMNSDGSIEDNIGSKGILLNRRDNCGFARDVYKQAIEMILEEKSRENVIHDILDNVQKLILVIVATWDPL